MRKRAWWNASGADLPSAVQQTVHSLAIALSEQREDVLHHLRLYSNFNISGQSDLSVGGYYSYSSGRLRFNMCAAVADTAASRVFTTKPTIQYVTEGANWQTRRKAVKRSEALQGQMYDLGGYVLAQRVGKDCLQTGTGIGFGFLNAENKPALRRLLPNQLLVDPAETLDGQATAIYLAYPADRNTLIDHHPELEQEILASGKDARTTEHLPQTLGYDSQVDQVTIYEGFRLGAGKRKGKHVICTDKVVLLEEDFEGTEFDIAVLRWVERPFGFFGQGIVERTKDAQWRINKLIKRIEKIQDLATNAMVFTRAGNGIEADAIHNSAVPVYTYENEAPHFFKFEATPMDLTQEISIIREQTLAQEGLNEQTTQGAVPAGVESGVAMSRLDSIQDVRLSAYAKAWEDWHVDMFRVIERLNDRAAEKDPSFTVLGRGTKGTRMTTKSYRWKDLELPSDDVRIRAAPMSSLPTTVAGKLDMVERYASLGLLNRDQIMEMLQIPDLDSAIEDQLAHHELAHMQMERIFDGEKGVFPIPYQDLQVASAIASLTLVQLETQQAPEEIYFEVEQYFNAVRALIEQAAAPAGPAVDTGAGPPMDAGALPPEAMGAPPVDPAMMGMPPGAPPMDPNLMAAA